MRRDHPFRAGRASLPDVDVSHAVDAPADQDLDTEVRRLALAALAEQRPVLLAAARVITFDSSEAEDLVQDTLEIAVRKLDQLRELGSLRAWLFRIQAREALRLRRRLRLFTGWSGDLDAASSCDEAEHAALRAALAGLPRRMRAAVVLHHMVGLSAQETAAAMGVSPNTAKTQIRLGVGKIRERLSDDQ